MASSKESNDPLEPAGRLPIQMVVQLKPTKPSGELLTPDESVELAEQVLTRVAGEVGRPANRVNILKNLSSIIVEADQDFQTVLARQPEVASVMPNKSDAPLSIPPIRKRKI